MAGAGGSGDGGDKGLLRTGRAPVKIVVTWEPGDITAGVKVEHPNMGLRGVIVYMPGPAEGDNVVTGGQYALMGEGYIMRTEFMKARELAQLLSEKGCRL